jgi:tetratricopeptide (TPR) repeat protein
MVGKLNELDPNDKRVLELTFVNALRTGDLEVAKVIAQNPANTRVETLAYQARVAITENETDRAADLLRQAVATGAADATTYQMLAVLQRNSGLSAESIESFKQALAIRPDNDDVILEYVLTLVNARQYEDALNEARRYQRYATSNDGFMNLWFSLEAQFGGQQGRSFATRQRERTLELNPTNTENSFQLARLYILDRNWDAARALIDTLRSQEDTLQNVELDATWYAEQGIVDGRDGLVQANEVFTKYIATLPEPVGPQPYIRSSQFMLSRGRPDLALAAANEAITRQSPETMDGTILLGDLNMRISNYTDAVRAYRQVVDAGVDNVEFNVHARLVDALVRLQRFDEAHEVYQKLPESKSSEIITMLQGADIANGQGDTSRAQQILDNAVSTYPNNPIVYIKRAEIMVGDESLSNDMLSDLNRALELDPNNWRAYRVRAAGYFALKQREEALDDLREAIRINPSLDRSIYSVLNELLSQPGRSGEAADVAREVLSQRSDDANLMTRIGGLFAARKEWSYASEFYDMAWDKRRAPSDGATLIDTLVRQTPPNINEANNIINELAAIVGNINENSGLLAAQALVLQARGRDDFAQQQITKAFDLSTSNTFELINWSNNLSRYFEERSVDEHISYLETLKRRNSNEVIGYWLDYFITQRWLRESDIPQSAYAMIESLEGSDIPDGIALRSYRLHGSTMFAQNNFEQAAAIWGEGLERFPEDWEMNNNLAYTLGNKLGKPEEALGYGEKAISQNISVSEPYETMASIYIALDRYDEAQQMIDTGSQYINSIPARVTMQLTSGRLALKRGDLVDARSIITDSRAILRSAPESYPTLEVDIDAFEAELDSAEN